MSRVACSYGWVGDGCAVENHAFARIAKSEHCMTEFHGCTIRSVSHGTARNTINSQCPAYLC